MYKRENKIIGSIENLSNYVEGVDVYNSELLHLMNDPELSKVPYEITVYEYRPDLIARDFYSSESYLGLLLIQTGLSLDQYTRGTVIYLLPKATLDALISNL